TPATATKSPLGWHLPHQRAKFEKMSSASSHRGVFFAKCRHVTPDRHCCHSYILSLLRSTQSSLPCYSTNTSVASPRFSPLRLPGSQSASRQLKLPPTAAIRTYLTTSRPLLDSDTVLDLLCFEFTLDLNRTQDLQLPHRTPLEVLPLQEEGSPRKGPIRVGTESLRP